MLSCKSKHLKYVETHLGNTKIMILPIGNPNDTFKFTYYVNDTISTLYISHHECTECLDAYVDGGTVFIPDSVAQKIIKKKNPPTSFDLKLIGKTKIDEELFGNQDNFMSKWHDRFLIKGKVVDIADGGLLFYVESYEKTHDEW